MPNIIESMYRETILELYRHPLNRKSLTEFDVEHRELNPVCGDDITIQIKFDTSGRVADVGHEGSGCVISQAAVSLVTDELRGKTRPEIMQIGKETVLTLLGVDIIPMRMQCALLGLKAIQAAVRTQAVIK